MLKLNIYLTIACAALLLTAPARAAEDDSVVVLTSKVFGPLASFNSQIVPYPRP